MKKIMAFLKSHWQTVAIVIGLFVAWRVLNNRIATVAETDNNAGATQLPIFTANAGGYAGGVSAGVSTGNPNATSDGTMTALMEQIKGANAAQLEAIKSTTSTAQQANALNSVVSSQIGNAFAGLFPGWLSDKSNQYQSLNVSVKPNATGGIDLTAKTDVNLQALPTKTQAANYLPGSALNSARPYTNTTDFSFANFDAQKLLRQRPDLANVIATNPSAKQYNWWGWGVDPKNTSQDAVAYAWWKNVGMQAGVPFAAKAA